MDPDANVKERISLLEKEQTTPFSTSEVERYEELRIAYAEWISKGGFPANPALLTKLADLEDQA